MNKIPIIKCHGSGNEFVMVDLSLGLESVGDLAGFARAICSHCASERSDGVLYVVRDGDNYAMRMFNPDGSEAEMCGNGIRCVARLVDERYEQKALFTLRSGGGDYPTTRAQEIAPMIATYGVDIAIRTQSPDFGFAQGAAKFVAQRIPSLDAELEFTALNLGNPHIVAAVDKIDMELLQRLGERVTTLKEEFPKGINISFYSRIGENRIFVATYERGAGITYSCGTAMTASSTASVLLGLCEENETIEVYNRGGMVRCKCRLDNGIVTHLMGNATYEWEAEVEWDGEQIASFVRTVEHQAEREAYEEFVRQIK